MATDTFDIASSAADGACYMSGSYPPASFTEYSDNTADGGENVLDVGKSNFGGTRFFNVSFLRFDTSGIGDSDTITAATLKLYLYSVVHATGGKSLVGDYYDFGGEPTVSGDYTETASPSIFSALGLGSITSGAVNDIALTDLTGINKTGYTGIRLTLSSGDITTSGQQNTVYIASYEHSTLQAAQLEVTYTPSGGGGGGGHANMLTMGLA